MRTFYVFKGRHGLKLLGPPGVGVARWLIGPCLTILVTSWVIYTALAWAPGDPVAQILGSRSTAEQRALLTHELGLDLPVYLRYWNWMTAALTGDLGISTNFKQPVTTIIAPRLLTTMGLVTYSAILITVIGIALGSIGGMSHRLRPYLSGLIGFGVALPGYVVALVLVGIFSVRLGWFPTFGAGSGFLNRLWHLTLPAVSLATGLTAYVAQISASAVREEMAREHVMTARTRGLPPVLIYFKHIMRNAAMPVITASGLSVASLIAGSVIVETAFAIDGVGSLLVKSVGVKDYSVVVAISVLIVTVFVLVNTVIGMLQNIIYPHRREEKVT